LVPKRKYFNAAFSYRFTKSIVGLSTNKGRVEALVSSTKKIPSHPPYYRRPWQLAVAARGAMISGPAALTLMGVAAGFSREHLPSFWNSRQT